MTVRFHLFPFRTQQLSSLVPKIVSWKRLVKIGSRRLEYAALRVLRAAFLYPRKESGKNGIIKNRDAALAAAPVCHRRRRGRFCDFVWRADDAGLRRLPCLWGDGWGVWAFDAEICSSDALQHCVQRDGPGHRDDVHDGSRAGCAGVGVWYRNRTGRPEKGLRAGGAAGRRADLFRKN